MNLMIIGFVGLPGSGKGEACRIAAMYGLPVLVMGDVIRREAARLGVEPTDQNLGRIGSDLRAAEGPDAVARRILDVAQATGGDVVVVDGLRSLEEADFFRSHADQFYLVEVCAPAEARLRRLEARGRPDDPGAGEGGEEVTASCEGQRSPAAARLEQRECREMGWGMCEAIKSADFNLRNDGSLDEFHENVKKLLNLLISSTHASGHQIDSGR